MNNRELKDIIDKIMEDSGLTLKDIAAKGVGERSYLSDLINSQDVKKVTSKLLAKFRKNFPTYFPTEHKTNITNTPISNGNDIPMEGTVSARELIEVLKVQLEEIKQQRDRWHQENDTKNRLLEANLNALSTGQTLLSAYVKAAVTREAQRYVNDDNAKAVKELGKIDKIYGQILEGSEMGIVEHNQGKG